MHLDVIATSSSDCAAIRGISAALALLTLSTQFCPAATGLDWRGNKHSAKKLLAQNQGSTHTNQGLPGSIPGAGHANPHASATATLRKGTQLIDAGRLPEALVIFQDYCRNRPGDASGYFWIGVCYDEMGNYPVATQAYRDGIARAEQNAMDSCEIRTNLGNVLLKQNEVDRAIEAYKRALEVNPQFGLAQLNLGRAYLAKSDFQSALTALNKCEELRFSSRQLPYYKAKALLGLGRKDEAAATVHRLLQDFPNGEAKNSMQQEFQSVLSK